MADAQQWGHDALAADLAGYLNSSEVMVWTDMQLGPSGSPRPDVYLVRKSYSKPLPLAFECKISRSDLRSDTTSGKWQTYLKYAAGVVFAVPDGLCTAADIPDGCGLIIRKAKEWRYARRPTLHKVEIPFEACLKLLIDGVHRTYRTREPQPRHLALWGRAEKLRKQFGKDIADCAIDLARARERLATIQETAKAEWERQEQAIRLHADQLRAQLAKDEPTYGRLRAELLAWLGMENGSTFGVEQRIRQLKRECDTDARIAEAERRLQAARRAVQSALANLPEPAPQEVPAWSIPA